jgi:hypothetical protein
LNVLAFYSVVFGKVRVLGPGAATPWRARLVGSTSLLCWIGVIVCGRMLTFYRPGLCGRAVVHFPFYCIP